MSAARTRILLGDDQELLARVRPAIASRPDYDVVTAASAEEALQQAAASRVAIFPAAGGFDGIETCRRLKAASGGATMVMLVVASDAVALRDPCFGAGADDVLFSPVDGADVPKRIEAPSGVLFRAAPRADVTLRVHLQTGAGKVLEVDASAVSREGLVVTLPAGANPQPNTLVRAIFTLYEGGTLTLYARATPGEPMPRAIFRFVGVTAEERGAIDYFVDFYRKQQPGEAKPEPWQEEPTGEQKASTAAKAAAAAAAPAVATSGDAKATDETLADILAVELGELAAIASRIAAGRSDVVAPAGFNLGRLRQFIPKLTPTENSALRGTTMYNDAIVDLRAASGAKLKLYEMTAQLKGGGDPLLSKTAAQQASNALIGEAERVHGRLEALIAERVKQANTVAVKDLNSVKTTLVSACLELKNTVDRDILGKAPTAAAPAVSAGPQPVRYDKPVSASAPSIDSGASAAAAKRPQGSGRGKRAVLGVFLLAGIAGAAWSNRGLFVPPAPQEFVAKNPELASGNLRVWHAVTRGSDWLLVVDDSWKHLDDGQRKAAVADLAKQAPPDAKQIRVLDARNAELYTQPIGAATTP